MGQSYFLVDFVIFGNLFQIEMCIIKKKMGIIIFFMKTFIISSFLVRFHFRLNHMTDLLILLDTKNIYIYKKYSIQLYRAIFLAVFATFVNLFQIEMGIIQKV